MEDDRRSIIESRTKEDIIKILKTHNLGINKRARWEYYSKAKKLCFEDLFIDPKIYDMQIGWITDYLKI